MTQEVITLPPETPMEKARVIFSENNIHHIPIVENQQVIGMVSTTDCHKLEHHFHLFRNERSRQINDAIFRSLLVKEVMTKPVVTVLENDTLEVAAGIFKENLFKALPVVNDQHELIGIITMMDLICAAF